MRTRSAAVSCACNMDVTVSSLIRSDPLSRGFETQDTLQAQSSCFQRQVLVISCSSRLFLTRFIFSTAPPHPYLALLRTDVCSAGVNVSETRSVIGSCITSGTRRELRFSDSWKRRNDLNRACCSLAALIFQRSTSCAGSDLHRRQRPCSASTSGCLPR